MTDEVQETLVSSYMSMEQPQYRFGRQGGETALLGSKFFPRAVSLQQKYRWPGAISADGVQTSETLIDDEPAKTLADYKFLTGVSLGGPAQIQDRFRKYPAGSSRENLSSLCRGWKKFYSRTLLEFKKIADELKREHA